MHVADSEGHVALAADGECTLLAGRDPVADTDPYSDTGYPFAAVRLHSLFADPRAPDLAVVHTGAHCWTDRGGHLGEHGSLNGLQSRAPLVLSGAGVADRGVVEGVARTVDVAATLAHLSGRRARRHGRPAGALRGARREARRRPALGRRAQRRAAGAGRRRDAAERRPAARARLRAARRRRRRVPERHAGQPHLRAHGRRSRPARHRQQRLLRPGRGPAGRPQRLRHLAPGDGPAAARGADGVRARPGRYPHRLRQRARRPRRDVQHLRARPRDRPSRHRVAGRLAAVGDRRRDRVPAARDRVARTTPGRRRSTRSASSRRCRCGARTSRPR